MTSVAVARSRSSAADASRALVPAVHAVMKGFLRRVHPTLEAEGISLGQFWALHVVSSLGATSLSSIARHLSVRSPTACAQTDPLVDAGLLVRRRSERDRRTIELRLTPRGRRIEARVWAEIGCLMDAAVAGIPPEELASAVRVFRQLEERLDGGGAAEGGA